MKQTAEEQIKELKQQLAMANEKIDNNPYLVSKKWINFKILIFQSRK